MTGTPDTQPTGLGLIKPTSVYSIRVHVHLLTKCKVFVLIRCAVITGTITSSNSYAGISQLLVQIITRRKYKSSSSK